MKASPNFVVFDSADVKFFRQKVVGVAECLLPLSAQRFLQTSSGTGTCVWTSLPSLSPGCSTLLDIHRHHLYAVWLRAFALAIPSAWSTPS